MSLFSVFVNWHFNLKTTFQVSPLLEFHCGITVSTAVTKTMLATRQPLTGPAAVQSKNSDPKIPYFT